MKKLNKLTTTILAAFISAVLLSLTVYAQSYKEYRDFRDGKDNKLIFSFYTKGSADSGVCTLGIKIENEYDKQVKRARLRVYTKNKNGSSDVWKFDNTGQIRTSSPFTRTTGEHCEFVKAEMDSLEFFE